MRYRRVQIDRFGVLRLHHRPLCPLCGSGIRFFELHKGAACKTVGFGYKGIRKAGRDPLPNPAVYEIKAAPLRGPTGAGAGLCLAN